MYIKKTTQKRDTKKFRSSELSENERFVKICKVLAAVAKLSLCWTEIGKWKIQMDKKILKRFGKVSRDIILFECMRIAYTILLLYYWTISDYK